jgi:hypothetical protein
MARKKRTDSGHKHKLVGLRLPEAVRLQVKALADAERRSLAQMCAILVEEALQARRGKV